MSEFKLHHLVGELITSLGSRHTPERFVDILQKSMSTSDVNVSNCIAIQNQIQQLAQNCENPQAFLLKFEDLRQKNVDALAPYIQLLSQISQDNSVKSLLRKTARRSTTHVAVNSNIKVTRDDVAQLKNRLKKAVTKDKVTKNESKLLQKTSLPIPSLPSLTSWVQRRPDMSWDFSSTNISVVMMGAENIPTTSQEHILIDDLLNVLIGLPSFYIEPEELRDPHAERTFKINNAVDLSLKELVKQILPLASYYSNVQRFTEEKMRFEFGQVNNALAEAMILLIADYTLFIAQLETEHRVGNLNLQKLWFYIQRNLQNMNIMSNIASIISRSDAKGGKVLSLLHDYINSSIGDEKAKELCLHLMQSACVPYMKMLGMWIYKGIISDPIGEFLVEDKEVIQKEDMPVDYSADYWDRKYIIRRERIPKFLEQVSDIIMRAGKYLNVIRQCGKTIINKVETIEYKLEEKQYIDAIEKAYSYASQTLLDLVIKEKDLIGRLKSVKHYFLLDQGDFIVTFLTLCEKELSKDVVDVIQARLESLLDLALRLSSATNDPYKDDLRTELLPYDLQFQMFRIQSIQTKAEQEYWASKNSSHLTVIESFSFSYEVHWPLSLILNRKSLACYQMIFRHLFYCKHVERMICQVWRSNKVAKKFPFHSAKQYRNAFALRQRMLHCVQNLEYHMMVEVIEPHWCNFLQKISKVSNVDEILSCHSDFLHTCLNDCMLQIPELLGIITKLLSICVNFCKFIQNEGNLLTVDLEESMEELLSFEGKISAFDTEFTATLLQLLEKINDLNTDTSDHDRLFNLLYRMIILFPTQHKCHNYWYPGLK